MTKLLVVDDDEQNLYMLQVLLQGHGYEVVPAANGVEALEAARCDPPDMIISDILMPVMDGFVLCRAWQKDDVLKTIPFVFYTATYTDPKDEEFALNLGAVRFIVKPVEPDRFVEMVRQILEAHEPDRPVTPREPVAEETVYYREYNEALIRKLEDKMAQLEQANQALKSEVAERKRAEETLRESEERYRLLLESISDGVYALDRQWRYVLVNDIAARFVQMSPENLLGKKITDLFPGIEETEFFKVYQHVMEIRAADVITHEYTFEDGRKGRYEVRVYPVPEGILCISTDISERKRIEDALRKAHDELEMRVEERTAELIEANKALQTEITERRRAEEALKRERDFNSTVLKTVDALVIVLDPQGRIVSFNRACEACSGYTFEEIRGKPFWDILLLPEEKEPVQAVFVDLKTSALPNRFENFWLTKDGRKRLIEWSNSVLKGADGSIQYVMGTGIDITERKRAEEELRNYRDHLEELVEERTAELKKANERLQREITERKQAEEALKARARQQATVAELGQQALVNIELTRLMDEAVALVGQTLEVEYCKVLELLPEGEALLLRAGAGWQAGLVGRAIVGAGSDSQAGYTLLSNEPVIVEDLRTETRFDGPPLLHDHGVVSGMSVIIGERDQPFGVLGAHTTQCRTFSQDDIHFLQSVANVLATAVERQRAEAALRESEERLRALVETTSDWVWEVDQNGLYTYASPKVKELLGYEPEELIGKTPFDLMPPAEAERVGAIFRDIMAAQNPFERFKNINLHKEGRSVALETSGVPILDPSGNLLGYRGIDRNITEGVQAEARLECLNRLKEDLLRPGSLQEKLKYITDGVVAIFGADFARIWITKPGDQCDSGCLHARITEGPHVCRYRERCLHLLASSGRYTHLDGEMHRRVPFGCYKIGRVAAGKDPKFITNDVTHDPQVHDHDWTRRLGLVSFAGYRLLSAAGEPIGVLALFSQHPISSDEDTLLEDLANTTAQVIQTTRAEEALRRSEQEKATILNSMSELMVYQDTELKVLWANKVAGESVGLPLEQLVGRFCYEIWHQRDEPCVGCPVVKAYQTGQAQEAEMSSPDGRVWFVRGHPVRDANGNVEGMVEVVRDITELKQVEETLRESEKRYQALFEEAPVMYLTVRDEQGKPIISNCNAAFLTTLGYTRAEVVGYPLANFYTPESRAALLAGGGFQQALKGEMKTPVERNLVARDGRIFTTLLRAVPEINKMGQAIGARAMFTDITERKRTEEVLWQRNRDLALLNRAGQVFSSTLDLDQVLVAVLEEVRQMLKVVACSVWLIQAETDELVCRQAVGPKSEMVRDWRVTHGQGIVDWVARHDESLIVPDAQADPRHFAEIDEKTGLAMRSILAVPLRAKGSVIGVLEVVDTAIGRFTATDLTLVELLASAAATAIENARLYEQTRRDAETQAVLLREVNHRVKNNLSTILGLLSIERRHAAQTESFAYQALVNDLASRIKGLAEVHSLLAVAQWQPLRLSNLIQKIIHTVLPSLPGGKSVSVNVTPSPVRVTPDQAHNLAMIINELTINTVKHALPERDTAQIFVSIRLDGQMIQIEFRDDGPGYAPDVLRLERQNVGLYLIQSLVHKGLRGEVDLRNDQGAVTTVRFKAMK